jgi:hypothetical protein
MTKTFMELYVENAIHNLFLLLLRCSFWEYLITKPPNLNSSTHSFILQSQFTKRLSKLPHRLIHDTLSNDTEQEQLYWNIKVARSEAFSIILFRYLNRNTCCFATYFRSFILIGRTKNQSELFILREMCHDYLPMSMMSDLGPKINEI